MKGFGPVRAMVLVITALQLVACGGGSGGADETRASTTPQTMSTVTVDGEAPDPGGELATYFDKIRGEQDGYEDVREKAITAFDRVDTDGPTESWITAADDLREARDAYNELAVRMKGIEPPAELASVHDGLAKSLQLFGQFTDKAQSDLRAKNLPAVLGWPETLNPLSTRINELRGDWRIEALAYAREIGGDVPPWVEKVGTQG